MDFKRINTSLDIHEVARWVGLNENRTGFVLCPFHNDHNASMRLYKNTAFCFSCSSWCDSIGLVAQVKGISQYEALRVLSTAFSVPLDNKVYSKNKRSPEQHVEDITGQKISLWSKAIKELLTIYIRDMTRKGISCEWAEEVLDEGYNMTDSDFFDKYSNDWRVITWQKIWKVYSLGQRYSNAV